MKDERPEFERLIAPIADRMIRTVWRIVRDAGDAEDAFQDALLNVWKRWDRIRGHPNPHALVLRICIHSALDVVRQRSRRQKSMEPHGIPEALADQAPLAAERLAGAQQGAEVMRAIASLSKNQAQAILLHAVDEMPYNDVAAQMGCAEATVRKHVLRARTKLRALLEHLLPRSQKEEGIHAEQ